MKPSRRWPAVDLNWSSLGDEGVGSGVWGVGEDAAGSATIGSGAVTTASAGGFCADSRAFFFRIFTRSTMDVVDPLIFRWNLAQAVLAGGGGNARCVDRLGVVAEGVEQCRGGQGVEHARDAAADGVHGP